MQARSERVASGREPGTSGRRGECRPRASQRSRSLGRVAGLAVLSAVVVAAGCSSTTKPGSSAPQSSATSVMVNVDGANPNANETFTAYFPNVVKVHPGDTVVFHFAGVGEPHTVTMGTLVDAAVSAFDALGPNFQGQPPPAALAADAKLPNLFPQGPGDAVPSAANPCYLDTGVPSASAPCPKRAQPDFTGRQAFYNSGWLDASKGADFTVHLSSSIPPGTYRVICLLHREGMTAKVVVVPRSTAIPSAAAQEATGRAQLTAIENQLQPAVVAGRQGKIPVPGVSAPGTNVVLAGSGSPAVMNAGIDEFGPKDIHVPVGGSVTWYFLGDHTVTFGSSPANNDVRQVAPDGTVHLNAAAGAPAGGPGEPPPPPGQGNGPPSGNPSAPPTFNVVASSTWDGTGLHSSGLFVNSFGPPAPIEGYKVTFTKAGTYTYICTIHDHMKGTVTVG